MREFPQHFAAVVAHLFFLLALLLGGPVGCDEDPSSTPTAPRSKALVFALPASSGDATEAADALATALSRPVELTFHETPPRARSALRRGKAHFALLDSWTFYEAHVAEDVQLVGLGDEPVTAHWYVLDSSPTRRLADLKGRRVAFTAPDSTAGFLLPLAALSEAGVVGPKAAVDQVFDRPFYSGSAEASLAALLDGRAEAAPLPDSLASEVAELRAIAPAMTSPGPVIAARPDMPRRTMTRVREALIATGADRALFELSGISAPNIDALTPIQSARRRTGVRLAK